MTKLPVISIVPIRAGSEGIPNKNLLEVKGKPLFMHAVHQGLRTTNKVIISTDIDKKKLGTIPDKTILCRRPSLLAKSDTPMASVIKHLIIEMNLIDSLLVLLQATSPLRSDKDILSAVQLYNESCFDMVMSVSELDNKVLKCGKIEGNKFSPLASSKFLFANRQTLPRVYSPNGAIYIFEAKTFVNSGGFPGENLGAFKMPEARSIDIDTLKDLEEFSNS